MNDTLVLIPAYQPTENLVELAGALFSVGFRILVVDDGSGDAYSEEFDRVGAYATVIGYETNRGKGSALKYGMEFIIEQMPYFKYVITVDSDGEHTREAISAVSDKLHKTGGFVIGARDPKKSKIPLWACCCNTAIRTAYTLLTGIYVKDIMSGLRGFELSCLKWLLKVEGKGFNYEAKSLVEAAKRRLPIITVKVREDDWLQNSKEKSHYHPVKDCLSQLTALADAGKGSLCAQAVQYALILIVTAIAGTSYAAIGFAVLLGATSAIALSVILNNRIGYEENFDGALSYNRILTGLLRFFVYFFLMEFLAGFMKIGIVLSLIITVAVTTFAEYKTIQSGVDKNLRIRSAPQEK